MRICYFPAGDRKFASSRLRVYKIGDELNKLGHTITYADRFFEADVVVVQKRADLTGVMTALKARGVRIIYDCDDWIPGLPVELADVVTVDTPYKQQLYPGAVVVDDALDTDTGQPFKMYHEKDLRRVVWVGNAANVYHTQNVAQACYTLNLDLTIISDLAEVPSAYLQGVTGVYWTPESVDSEIVRADLLVCPFIFDGTHSDDWIKSKSANRVLKGWSLGMPVAGTPIPSYVEAGMDQVAYSVQDWIETLAFLSYREIRIADAQLGFETSQNFTADKMAQKWLEVFKG